MIRIRLSASHSEALGLFLDGLYASFLVDLRKLADPLENPLETLRILREALSEAEADRLATAPGSHSVVLQLSEEELLDARKLFTNRSAFCHTLRRKWLTYPTPPSVGLNPSQTVRLANKIYADVRDAFLYVDAVS